MSRTWCAAIGARWMRRADPGSGPAAGPAPVVPHRAGWLDDDPRPGAGGGRRPVQAGSRSSARQPAHSGKRSGRNVFGARRTAPLAEAPGRGPGHASRELPGERSAGSLRIGPPAGRGPCRCRDPPARSSGPLRAGTRPGDRFGDCAAPRLRLQRGADRRRCEGRAAGCGSSHPDDPAGHPPRPAGPRQRLPLPRLHVQALCRRPPREALGEWRGNQAQQPRHPVPLPSSTGA